LDLGPIIAIEYEKRTPEGAIPYRHDFARRARPTLSHDERGRLHVIGSRYTTSTRGIEDMPVANPLRRRSRSRRRHALRANPTGAIIRAPAAHPVEFLGRNAAVIGGVVLGEMIAGELLLARTRLSPEARGAARAALSVGLGVLTARKMPRFALGSFIAALASLGLEVARGWRARQFMASLTGTQQQQQQQQQQTTQTTTTTPGQLPAGTGTTSTGTTTGTGTTNPSGWISPPIGMRLPVPIGMS
jgi:hypothetical protein